MPRLACEPWHSIGNKTTQSVGNCLMDEAQDGSGHSQAPGSTSRGAKGVANPAGREREQKAMISKLADIDSSTLDPSTLDRPKLDRPRGDGVLRDGTLRD